MNEIIIYRIIIGVVIVGIFWLYFRRNKVNQVDDKALIEKELIEKDKEIEVLKTERDGFKKTEKDLRESLTREQNLVKDHLATINKIDQHKNSIHRLGLFEKFAT